MLFSFRLPVIAAALALVAPGAHADVVISSAATQNMTCSAGVCAPTAASAVLNVGDLETMLASGGVVVTTTGLGVQANKIRVVSPLAWSSTAKLSLRSHSHLEIDNVISIEGLGDLSLIGRHIVHALTFDGKGRISFRNTSSGLIIGHSGYTLVKSIRALARAISANNSGHFALASNYIARGTYKNSPILTTFTGVFEGLGNSISGLSIDSEAINVGLFSEIGTGGRIRNLVLISDSISAGNANVGAIAGTNLGTISRSSASGTVMGGVGSDEGNSTGGLVGYNAGRLIESHADGEVDGGNDGAYAGGLVGLNDNGTIEKSASSCTVSVATYSDGGGLVGVNGDGTGIVERSYATGTVSSNNPGANSIGGLIGYNGAKVVRSYATGDLSGSAGAGGGMVGINFGAISESYSTGAVSAGQGGFVGYEGNGGSLASSYWDTTTSGTDQGTGEGNVTGLTGLTTEQLQSGLPHGFDPKIWAEDSNINNGLPYLIANPPRN